MFSLPQITTIYLTFANIFLLSYISIMKWLLLILFNPLLGSAQSAYVKHYKSATSTDTTFAASSGLVKIDTSQITINGVSYGKTYTGTYSINYTYQAYTLDNGWSAVVTRFWNNELEAVTVDEGTQQETFYFR